MWRLHVLPVGVVPTDKGITTASEVMEESHRRGDGWSEGPVESEQSQACTPEVSGKDRERKKSAGEGTNKLPL